MTQKMTQDVAWNGSKWPEMTTCPVGRDLGFATRISTSNGGKPPKSEG
jgi:hypothetical protein